jgi:CheY-like chemotaxis protein
MNEDTKKILIVDDDMFLRQMYVTKFIANGFDVDSAGSSKEALEKIEGGFIPDVLLFDIIMPINDGWYLIQNIREKNILLNTKMIVLSNQGETNDIENSKKFKVDGYIVKALKTPSEVVNEVKQISKF